METITLPSGSEHLFTYPPHYFLKLRPHSLGVAYRGSSLVCYNVTYLEYKSACGVVVYAIPVSHITDMRELAMDVLQCDRIISKATLNSHGEVDAPSLIK